MPELRRIGRERLGGWRLRSTGRHSPKSRVANSGFAGSVPNVMVRIAPALAVLLAVGAAPAAYAVDAPAEPSVRVPLPAPTTAAAAAPAAAATSGEELVGTFRLKAGDC